MGQVKATFIFCEGDHDIAFCHLILKHLLNATLKDVSDVQAPAPLGDRIRQLRKEKIAGASSKIFTYSNYYTLGDNAIFVYKTDGKDNPESTKKLISDMTFIEKPSLSGLQSTPAEDGDGRDRITSSRYLFVYDRDEKSLERLIGWWRSVYDDGSECGMKIPELATKTFDQGCFFENKALYGWSVGDSSNTLEDILLVVLKDCAKFPVDKSSEFANALDAWSWEPCSNKPKDISAAKAKFGKAVITISGQNARPGRAMSTIIRDCLKRNKNEDEEKVALFKQNKDALAFAEFLRAFMNG